MITNDCRFNNKSLHQSELKMYNFGICRNVPLKLTDKPFHLPGLIGVFKKIYF